jgi:hypothetical protein
LMRLRMWLRPRLRLLLLMLLQPMQLMLPLLLYCLSVGLPHGGRCLVDYNVQQSFGLEQWAELADVPLEKHFCNPTRELRLASCDGGEECLTNHMPPMLLLVVLLLLLLRLPQLLCMLLCMLLLLSLMCMLLRHEYSRGGLDCVSDMPFGLG